MEQIEFVFEYTKHYEIVKVDEVKETICERVDRELQDAESGQNYGITFHYANRNTR